MLFLLLASPWFLFADLILLTVLIALTEHEQGIAAGFVFIAAFLGLSFFSGWAPIMWIIAHPGTAVAAVAVYGLIGIVWSITKWFFYTRKEATQNIFKKMYKKYQSDEVANENERKRLGSLYNPKTDTMISPKTFDEYLKSHHYDNPLDPSKNKIRITRWMIWWPTSFIWTLLSDLVINIFNFVYDKIAFIFTAILNSQIKRAIKDVENS